MIIVESAFFFDMHSYCCMFRLMKHNLNPDVAKGIHMFEVSSMVGFVPCWNEKELIKSMKIPELKWHFMPYYSGYVKSCLCQLFRSFVVIVASVVSIIF
jgi:hypothetical protein